MDINVDKIKSGIDKAAVYTVKTTDKVVSSAKLNLKKNKLRGKLDSAYKKLGRLVYENAVNEGAFADFEESFNALKTDIDGYNEALSACEEELKACKAD